MKADIPDKILINRDEDGKIHHSYWTTDKQLIPFEDVEYIRKDTLIEWLENKIAKNEEGGFVAGLINLAYQDVLNKLNSM